MSSNSTFFGIIFSYWKSRTPAERFLRDVNGAWIGRVVYSPTSNIGDTDYQSINVTFNTEESRGFSSIAASSPDKSIDSQYFFKIEDNNQSMLSITNRFDEEVALFKLNYTDGVFTIRGRFIPSNDALTGLFKGRNMMFTITDQFTDNITTILLESTTQENIFHYYYHIFLFIMVLVAISAGLYKMSDLSLSLIHI